MRPTRARRHRTGGVIRFTAATLAAMLAGGALFVSPSAAVAAPTIAERQQWYFDLLRISEAQKISNGAGVVVGVVDSGVDASHPDLQGQVLPGKGVNGEAADGRSDREDGHGTGMAGTIAGIGGGPNRMTGIAPGVKILPYAVGADDQSMELGAAGIRWAADNGAKVINLSWGGGTVTPQYLADAVNYALSKDVVVVAAAGNLSEGAREVITPARIRGVIAVTGIGTDGAFWAAQSAQGRGAVLSAPAQDIIGPQPPALSESGYGIGGGTSAAAAIVSGVAAMVRAKYPDLDAANVIERLIRTADDKGPEGWDGQYGDGIVNPVAALTEDVPAVDRNPLLGDDTDGGTAAEPAPEDDGLAGNTVLLIAGGICLLLVVVVVVAIIAAASRGNKRRPGPPMPVGAPGPYPQPGPYPPQQGGYPPQQGSPGYPPPQPGPPGYPPQQQYPPQPGPQYPPPGPPYRG
ncbi:S8 family serine peptidase [Catenuloplanes atrovinosus]|uniref:Type VII secretion-associated serine protease mycosin n=1 Tax=Catenuloplanes atrovinosus TaxID=137266 RepID=A0AAE3YUA8_9ACTN|nr:S8 family serine peptidase [Catenuloplanes atrovinosus]MDR7278538.1 type VII secretion-associated serine protease mycosin [Catenuloplanes atrovinosus]